MNFEAAMSLVELEHEFPRDLREFHNRRTRKLFDDSGLSQALEAIPLVVVTGSCGKASTARYLAECAAELFSLTGVERPVGLGTKPPLFETLDGNRERYQLLSGGTSRWIEHSEFANLVRQLPPLGKGVAPYDLRYWILGQMFLTHQVGLGIVEANIGFRHDPAAVFPNPVAQLLTPIGVDHESLLTPEGAPESVLALGKRAGPTWHKACALQSNTLVVCGRQSADVEAVVKSFNPNLVLAERDFLCEIIEETLISTVTRIHLGEESLEIQLQTLGRHQAENASQAAACLWSLWERGHFKASKTELLQAISTGLSRTKIPGRMERLDCGVPVILNAATGVIKIEGMMATVEDVLEDGQTVWVCMSVLDRLVDSEIPDWLDICLKRILGSPRVIGFTATAFSGDLRAEALYQWAKERSQAKPIERFCGLAKLFGRADLVLLVGQSQARFTEFQTRIVAT